MRIVILVFAVTASFGLSACTHTNAGIRVTSNASPHTATATTSNSVSDTTRVDFSAQIKPILEARCQPCHFSGGKVYAKMPFDRAETIKTLGTKLFTRIKDENERELIRNFLAQQ